MVRIPSDREPTHPGEMLLREFLVPLGMTEGVGQPGTVALPASQRGRARNP